MTKNKESSHLGWRFDNSYARLPEFFYSKQSPAPVASPQLVLLNHSLAVQLGLNIEELTGEKGAEIFAGNQLPEGAFLLLKPMQVINMVIFTMLGDGRFLLGEQVTPQGKI